MDPISAIAGAVGDGLNAVGQIFTAGFGFGESKQQTLQAEIYLDSITQPEFIDHFEDDKMELYLSIGLLIVILALIIAITLKK